MPLTVLPSHRCFQRKSSLGERKYIMYVWIILYIYWKQQNVRLILRTMWSPNKGYFCFHVVVLEAILLLHSTQTLPSFVSCRNIEFNRIWCHRSHRNWWRSRQRGWPLVRHASRRSRLFPVVRFNRFGRKRSNNFLAGPRQPHRHLHRLSASTVDKFARFLLRPRLQPSRWYGGDASQATPSTFKNSRFFILFKLSVGCRHAPSP